MNCSYCGKTDREVVFKFTQAQTKDSARELALCARCLNIMVLNMFCWNSDLPNKAFNYVSTLSPIVK